MILDILVMQDTGIFEGEGETELQILQQFFCQDSHGDGLFKHQS